MLIDLLRALADDKPRTMLELAVELGTDADGLRHAVELCERLGYLVRTGSGLSLGCDGSCGKCGGTSAPPACGTPPTGAAWWQVTERGRRAARLTVVARGARTVDSG